MNYKNLGIKIFKIYLKYMFLELIYPWIIPKKINFCQAYSDCFLLFFICYVVASYTHGGLSNQLNAMQYS